MIREGYEEAADRFFAELLKPGREGAAEAFGEMLRERVYKSAADCARRPDMGVGQWAGGQISVCDELLTRLELARAPEAGDATPDDGAGFQPGP